MSYYTLEDYEISMGDILDAFKTYDSPNMIHNMMAYKKSWEKLVEMVGATQEAQQQLDLATHLLLEVEKTLPGSYMSMIDISGCMDELLETMDEVEDTHERLKIMELYGTKWNEIVNMFEHIPTHTHTVAEEVADLSYIRVVFRSEDGNAWEVYRFALEDRLELNNYMKHVHLPWDLIRSRGILISRYPL